MADANQSTTSGSSTTTYVQSRWKNIVMIILGILCGILIVSNLLTSKKKKSGGCKSSGKGTKGAKGAPPATASGFTTSDYIL